ncbi:MAG: HEAT repeat domain-containing protein [bacterium]
MVQSNKKINESTLNVNLNILAHNLIRELSMACRKVSIYGSNHPMSAKAVVKPYSEFTTLFSYKKKININIDQGHLFTLNIRLKDSPFTEEIMRYLQVKEINAIVFDNSLLISDFTRFIGWLVEKTDRSEHMVQLNEWLKKNNILGVEINSQLAYDLFEKSRHYRGDVDGDYTVKALASHQIGDQVNTLIDIVDNKSEILESKGIDFNSEVLFYLLPEIVASMHEDVFKMALATAANEINNTEDDELANKKLTDQFKSLWKIIDYHPMRESITAEAEVAFKDLKMMADLVKEMGDPVKAIKLESKDSIDKAFATCLEADQDSYKPDIFVNAFFRLLKTGQQKKGIEVINDLLSLFGSAENMHRSRALDMAITVLDQLDFENDSEVLENLQLRLIDILKSKKESFEYSEFIWRMMEKHFIERRYLQMSRLAMAIGSRKHIANGITVYDSVVIKKIIENINHKDFVAAMIHDMTEGDHMTTDYLKEVLMNTGGEEVALELSKIISHPDRFIRQLSLKILAKLGKSTLNVFSDILMDDIMFERDEGRRELSEEKWYVIRNSIYILGQLKDEDGIAPLRLRINDPDIRVRREIVATLEKIGGEDACDLLSLMAEDSDREICDQAVLTLGLIGSRDLTPLLINLIENNTGLIISGIIALGKMGGDDAKEYLSKVLNNEEYLSELTAGKVSRQDTRLAAVNALGEIGDEIAMDKLKEFHRNLTTKEKLLLNISPINKAVKDILARHA